MIRSEQIKAARVLLCLDQKQLAKAAKVGLTTIQRLEKHGSQRSHVASVQKVTDVLEALGVEFIAADTKKGFGVRRKF